MTASRPPFVSAVLQNRTAHPSPLQAYSRRMSGGVEGGDFPGPLASCFLHEALTCSILYKPLIRELHSSNILHKLSCSPFAFRLFYDALRTWSAFGKVIAEISGERDRGRDLFSPRINTVGLATAAGLRNLIPT